LVAILSGMVIFPAVFSFGLEPTQGPTLLFNTMPNIFQQMPGGYVFSILFFLLVYFAAVTSQVSLLETVAAFASEELRMKRWKACLAVALTMSVTGSMCALSLSGHGWFEIGGKPLFDIFDSVSSNVMLPLGGFFIVLFAGWIMPSRVLQSQLTNSENESPSINYVVLRFLIRFVSPIFVALLFLTLIGVI
jgi:NSS family neurotransmitter:Na+ symporter